MSVSEWAVRAKVNGGNLSRIVRGVNSCGIVVLERLLSATHVPPLPMLRALARARKGYLEQRKVMKVVDGYAGRAARFGAR